MLSLCCATITTIISQNILMFPLSLCPSRHSPPTLPPPPPSTCLGLRLLRPRTESQPLSCLGTLSIMSLRPPTGQRVAGPESSFPRLSAVRCVRAPVAAVGTTLTGSCPCRLCCVCSSARRPPEPAADQRPPPRPEFHALHPGPRRGQVRAGGQHQYLGVPAGDGPRLAAAAAEPAGDAGTLPPEAEPLLQAPAWREARLLSGLIRRFGWKDHGPAAGRADCRGRGSLGERKLGALGSDDIESTAPCVQSPSPRCARVGPVLPSRARSAWTQMHT